MFSLHYFITIISRVIRSRMRDYPTSARFLMISSLPATRTRGRKSLHLGQLRDRERDRERATRRSRITCAFLQDLHGFSDFQGQSIARVPPPVVHSCKREHTLCRLPIREGRRRRRRRTTYEYTRDDGIFNEQPPPSFIG